MKTRIVFIFLSFVMLTALLSSCLDGDIGKETVFLPCDTTGEEGELPAPVLSSFSQLNSEIGEADDHKGVYNLSVLELDYRNSVELYPYQLGTDKVFYPRIKKLQDGSYILFYSSERTGPDLYCIRSTDMKNWSAPKCIAKRKPKDGGWYEKYANGDAVQLKNGDIIFAYTFFPSKGSEYQNNMHASGIITVRSKDGGATWSDPEIVYRGMCWEPALIELANGDVIIIFTHSGAYAYEFGYVHAQRSTGNAILRSKDGGYSWEPKVDGPPYAAQRVMQIELGYVEENGKRFRMMGNQMPVPLLLNNGTIAVAAETSFITRPMGISMAYFYDNFETELAMFEEGPSDRLDVINNGNGPYLVQFLSGETLLTYGRSGNVGAKIGDENAKNFGEQQLYLKALTDRATWPACEIVATHTAAVVAEERFGDAEDSKDIDYKTLHIAPLNLNHRIDAKSIIPVIDGNSYDWRDNTDALFVGSESRAQVSLRAAWGEGKLYFFLDCLDEFIETGDGIIISACADISKKEYIKIFVSSAGESKAFYVGADGEKAIDGGRIVAKTVLFGTYGDDSDVDEGYTAEIALDTDGLINIGSSFRVNLILQNTDKGLSYPDDSFENSEKGISFWQLVNLK